MKKPSYSPNFIRAIKELRTRVEVHGEKWHEIHTKIAAKHGLGLGEHADLEDGARKKYGDPKKE